MGSNFSWELDASELIDAPTDSGAGRTRIPSSESTDEGARDGSLVFGLFCQSEADE